MSITDAFLNDFALYERDRKKTKTESTSEVPDHGAIRPGLPACFHTGILKL